MDAPVGPFGTKVSGPNLEISDFVRTIAVVDLLGWRTNFFYFFP